MKLWVTSIKAIDPIDHELKSWAGPYIEASSAEEAFIFCSENGLGYCEILGEFIETIEDSNLNFYNEAKYNSNQSIGLN